MGSTKRIIWAVGFVIVAIMKILGGVAGDTVAYNSVTPLSGTRQRWPILGPLEGSTQRWSDYNDYEGPPELKRLLDVGACLSSITDDKSISYVPPLDGTSSAETRCFDQYIMKFVLFDLQLVNLKAFDAVAGSFTAELQLVLHWHEYFNNVTSPLPERRNNCTFLCDTTSAEGLCCDDIWVPPLRLPGCTINALHSVTPTPYLYWNETTESDRDLLFRRRRFWYLNIDATCAAKPDFHNFYFDVQKLTIDFINPYASRTWFQLNKGLLRQNIGEGIAGIDLHPDRKIAGWDIKDFVISSSCGTQQSWHETFLMQDYLLSALSDKNKPAYERQQRNIIDALDADKNLKCAEMKSVNLSDQAMLSNPADLQPYLTTIDDYEERVTSTLQSYRECVSSSGYDFYLNNSASEIDIPDLGSGPFNVSEENINRSFGLLDLTKNQPTKVSFECAIAAVANLTTPGIRTTILVQRYRRFFFVKLVVPTIACVAFAFSAFGLQPRDLMGRLTVVVPSAIALTALQGLVVADDIPPIAYIAPTIYIILTSYVVQLLIAIETVMISSWVRRSLSKGQQDNTSTNKSNGGLPTTSDAGQQDNTSMISTSNGGPATTSDAGQQDNTSMISTSNGGLPTTLDAGQQDNTLMRKSNGGLPTTSHAGQQDNTSMSSTSNGGLARTSDTGQQDNTSISSTSNELVGDPTLMQRAKKIRMCDLGFMGSLATLYIVVICVCTILPWLRSSKMKNTLPGPYVSMWN